MTLVGPIEPVEPSVKTNIKSYGSYFIFDVIFHANLNCSIAHLPRLKNTEFKFEKKKKKFIL